MERASKESRNGFLTRKQIERDLKQIGVREGDHLAVSLSFKSMGFISGGPNAFIDALLDVVGPEGTIMVNTFTKLFPASEIPFNYVFDAATTTPYTGIVPRFFLKRKDAVRSKHPVTSVAAIGKLSSYLTEDHDEKAAMFQPYEKLAQIGGKYLAIGLGNRLVAIRHEAQKEAGYFGVLPLICGVRYKDAKGKTELYLANPAPCVKNLHMIVPKIEAAGLITRGKIGNAAAVFASADKLIEALVKILKEEPELSICDDIFCLYCREHERRKNLYQKIKNPKLFQKNWAARKILGVLHKAALIRFNHFSPENPTLKDSDQISVMVTIKNLLKFFIRKITNR